MRSADTAGRTDDASFAASDPGRLFLWFPVGLALRKVRRFLRQTDEHFCTVPTGALVVDAPRGYPDELLGDLGDLLTDDEGADTRCVFKAGPGDLDVSDIRRVRTIAELRRLRGSAWLLDMLRGNRLTSVFQPIVHADETSRVLGHEALVRGIGDDGEHVLAGSLFDAARGCGMLSELDLAARRSAISAAATQDERRRLFINLTSDAVRSGIPDFALTIDAVDAADLRRDHVVFEMTEAEQASDVRQLRSVVHAVRDAGFRVALDDVGYAEHARRLVHEVRPDFVKLDMERVRTSPLPRTGDAERLMDLAQHLKVETIAEGVETSEELEWNRARGVTYVQGYFIARPAALRASLAGARAVRAP